MKHLFVAAALLFPAAVSAQLEWKPDLLDFGTIKETDGKTVRSFIGRNIGSEPVRIDRVRTSCGCTTAVADTVAIQPGDSIVLPVTYNPAARPGPFDKPVWVIAGGKTYKLGIIGNVVPSEQTIAMRYPSLVGGLRMTNGEFVFGEVLIGSRRTKRLYGYNPSPDTLVIRFAGLPAYISGSVLPDTVPPSGLFCLSVAFSADRRSDFGAGEDSLKLDVNGKILSFPAKYTMTAGMDYRLQELENAPVAVFSIDRLVFNGYGTAKKEQVLGVRNEGKSDLRIVRISSAEASVSTDAAFPMVIEPGGRASITVTVDGGKEKNEVLNGAIIVMTNDPVNPNKLVRIVGKR